MGKKHKETELYAPVASFLSDKGFKVRGEIKGCDIAAVKEETLVIVELKLSFNTKLLMQAVSRLSITDYVYVALPRPAIGAKNGIKSSYYKDMINILKRLQVGLFLVSLDSPLKTVEPILHPMTYSMNINNTNRLRVIKEIDGRVGDFNTGGSSRGKISTAYREKSVQLACILYVKVTASTKELRLLGISSPELTLLQKNFYGWFERVERGVYTLTERGRSAVTSPESCFEKLVAYYMNYAKEMLITL